jgi:undecaprenyl-diphosphatase
MKKFFLSRTLFLSSIFVLWLFVFAILTDLTEDVVNTEQIINFDKYWAGVFLAWRSGVGTSIFSIITLLGNLEFALPLIILVLLFLILKKYQTFIWPFIFTVGSAELVTLIGKVLVHRVRPEGGALVMLDFSFPSGHSTIAVALYGYLAYLLICQLKDKLAKIGVAVGALIIILVIGFSRLYLGVHYVSDILAGYMVGFLALLAGISLREWLVFKSKLLTKNK